MGEFELTGATASTTEAPGDTGLTSTSDAGESTAAIEPCSLVHSGDLFVKQGTDLTYVANVGVIAGVLSVYNTYIASLGPNSALRVMDNPLLREIVDLGTVKGVHDLWIQDNDALEDVSLNHLESIGRLIIGGCNGTYAGDHGSLRYLSGFSSLTTIEECAIIEGNKALESLGFLDSIIANRGPPVPAIGVRRNPLLPEDDALLQLNTLGGGFDSTVGCGNLG